jgi:hypothetical protein
LVLMLLIITIHFIANQLSARWMRNRIKQ